MRLVFAVVFALALFASPTLATPITATLDGCVTVDDPRLGQATWFAPGSFQAVAFDDPTPGCDPTIYAPTSDAYLFDQDRLNDTMFARLDLDNLPTCGRRQYDLHLYLSNNVLDPMGLRSLVIDTGVSCGGGGGGGRGGGGGGGGGGGIQEFPPVPVPAPEPSTVLLVSVGLLALRMRRRNRA